jgi:hypothetical protein
MNTLLHTVRATRTTLAMALALITSDAFAAPSNDITVRPPAGGGFAVQSQDGNTNHLRVQEGSGRVSLPGLPAATAQDQPTCFNAGSGVLGPCASGVGSGAGSMSFSSTSAAATTTVLGGVLNQVAVLPLSGHVVTAPTLVLPAGSPLVRASGTEAGTLAQPFSRSGTLTAFSATAQLTQAMALIASTLQVTAQLYTGPSNNASMTAVPGAVCTFAPVLSGILPGDSLFSCSTTGLTIPIQAGTVGLIVVRSTVVAGLDTATSLQFVVGASLNID